MKFFVETFGCQMNTSDSQEMARSLMARGFVPSDNARDADCILVNTCTVRQHAEDKAVSFLGRLAEWKEADPRRVLVVAGCAAERLGEKNLKRRFPHVDLVVGAKSIDRFDRLLDECMASPPRDGFDARGEDLGSWSRETRIERLLPEETVSAHVSVMRGCNYACSYCVVPSVRGREVYRPAGTVLSEVRQKAALGLKEVILLGQTVNSYRPSAAEDGVSDFAGLLRAVNQVPGVRRIRFMSPHPFYLDEKTANAMAESENVCRHMHLPVQSGSDGVLERMRRNYTRSGFLEKMSLLRRAMPDIFVTTDFIVGFPGETEEDFRATISLASEADFDGAYVFKYSSRPGTVSAGWPDDVPEAAKEARHGELLSLMEGISTKKTEAFVNRRREVLVESKGEHSFEGRLREGRKVFFTSGTPHRPGDLVPVDITGASGRTLKGRAV